MAGRSAPVVDGDVYLPIKTLAVYSGLGERTLRGYLSHPGSPLPHYRIGGRVLVRRSDYDAWAARFRIVPSASVDTLVDDALRKL